MDETDEANSKCWQCLASAPKIVTKRLPSVEVWKLWDWFWISCRQMSVLCYKGRPFFLRINKLKKTITQTVYKWKSDIGEATAHKSTRNTGGGICLDLQNIAINTNRHTTQLYRHTHMLYVVNGTLTEYVGTEWRYSCLQLHTTSRSWTRGQNVTWWHCATKDWLSIVHLLLDAMHITPGVVSRSVQLQVFWSHRSGSWPRYSP